MKFWKEDTEMTSSFCLLLKERVLLTEIILITEKARHATVITVNGANWGAMCRYPPQNEAAFLKGLFQAFCLTRLCSHLLMLATVCRVRVIHRNGSVLLLFLLPSICLVHPKCLEYVWPK